MTQKDKICLWMEAASLINDGTGIARRVIVAGEFLEKVGHLNDPEVRRCLSEINFQMPVNVVRLPHSVFIQPTSDEPSYWYTNTGLRSDVVGHAHGGRRRKLFVPICSIPALKITARCPDELWASGHLLRSFASESGGRGDQLNRGGGDQYIAFAGIRLKEV